MVIRYYLATGRYPFEGTTVYTLFESIGKADYQIPPSVDSELSDLIRGILQADKKKRLSLNAILTHQYDHLSDR